MKIKTPTEALLRFAIQQRVRGPVSNYQAFRRQTHFVIAEADTGLDTGFRVAFNGTVVA